MFKIKDIRINNNILYITDKKDICHSMNLNDNRIANLIPKASNRSRQIQKLIRYFEKYNKICWICCIICVVGAIQPAIFMKSYAEFFFVIFSLVGIGAISLAVTSKMFIKYLKTYSINNECWQDVLEVMINNKGYKNTVQKTHTVLPKTKTQYSFQNTKTTNNTYSYKRDDIIQDSKLHNEQGTYRYSKNNIIQDEPIKEKVKVYKKY